MAGGSRREQILGVIGRRGGRSSRRGLQQAVEGHLSAMGGLRGDNRQTGESGLRQAVLEHRRIVHVDAGGVQHAERTGQPLWVRAAKAVLRRDRRNGHALAHGRIGDQGVVDSIHRQDQQRSRADNAQALQTAGDGANHALRLGEGDRPPARAGAFGQPDPVGRLGRPEVQGRRHGGETGFVGRRVGQHDLAAVAAFDLQPAGRIACVAERGGCAKIGVHGWKTLFQAATALGRLRRRASVR